MADFGTVISTIDGPSTRKFSFVINKEAAVRKGQFVQLSIEDGKLIGRVADVYKTNRYFMHPESVKEYESSGKQMNDIFPVYNWEYLVAEVTSLGVFTGDRFHESVFPPSPGTRVGEPDQDVLRRFFGLDDNGLHLGTLHYYNLDIKLNMTRLLQKHLAILAISGAGKSFLTAVLIEELLTRSADRGQVGVVVIDTHGEYTSFAEDPAYAAKTLVFPSGELRIGMGNLSPHQIGTFLPKLSAVQLRELGKVMNAAKRTYGIGDLIQHVEESETIKPATKDVLVSELTELAETGLFGAADYPPLEELAVQGSLTVIDLSDTISIRKKQILVAYLMAKLFRARQHGIVPPFLTIVEEAHQFVPEQGRQELALSKGILNTIAREGRKFGASLCLISQRPKQLSTTALSQCNTNIFLRITNPYDLKHIGESSEGLTSDVLNHISSLPVGTGIIVGEAVNSPLFVSFRRRTSRPSTKGLSLEQAAIEYHKRISQKRKDVKAFM